MLKIARQHVSAAIQGKSVDEIIQNAESNNLKLKKPMGYVSAEDVFKTDVAHFRNKENILQDKSNILNSMEKKNREDFSKSKFNRAEKPVDRIRKVINFGDEINVGSVRWLEENSPVPRVESNFLNRLKAAKKVLHFR